jgi:hypothetical protein
MAAIIDISSSSEPVIAITRVFDAPRTLVWKAITDPKHLARWYGGPGFTSPVCEMSGLGRAARAISGTQGLLNLARDRLRRGGGKKVRGVGDGRHRSYSYGIDLFCEPLWHGNRSIWDPR